MTSITIRDGKTSIFDAITWCQLQFGTTAFQVENQFPSWNWIFKFSDPHQATHFALKWSS